MSSNLIDFGAAMAQAMKGEPAASELVQKLTDECGAPAYLKGNRVKSLNEVFWARLYATENQILFEPGEDKFFVYDAQTGAWREDSENNIRKRIARRIFELGGEWQEFYPGLTEFRNERSLRGIICHLKGETEEKGAFDHDRAFIHCANCMVEFDDEGEPVVKPFSPDYRSRRPSPLSYDAKADCPDFKRMLLGHLSSADQELLQKVAGQCLIGRNLTQRIFILDGPGKASKGAFVSVLREVVGRQGCGELRTHLLQERFEVSRLMNKSVALGADVPDDFLLTKGAAVLKSLVGGDWKDYERKGSNDAKGAPGVFNVVVTANARLKVNLKGDRSAWERRLTIVRYDRPFTGNKIPDVHLMLLEKEGPGILNWFVQGAQKVLQDIQAGGDILLSPDQKRRVEDLLNESDSLELFLKARVQTSSDGDDLTTDEIVSTYAQYCINNGWDMIPVSTVNRRLPDLMSQLFRLLKRHDIERDGKDRNGFGGVKFRPEGDES